MHVPADVADAGGLYFDHFSAEVGHDGAGRRHQHHRCHFDYADSA
jgi:hypothetical protein